MGAPKLLLATSLYQLKADWPPGDSSAYREGVEAGNENPLRSSSKWWLETQVSKDAIYSLYSVVLHELVDVSEVGADKVKRGSLMSQWSRASGSRSTPRMALG